VTRPAISVVIPAYNEERAIVGTVERACAWLDAHGEPYELIVVDNASSDRTAELVAGLGHPHVRVLRNEANRGKGYSMRRGMLDASGELRLHCDADCADSFRSLPRMLELLGDADVVVGSRLAAGAEVGQRQPLYRRIVGRTFVELCRRVLAEPTHDLFCGFKLWRAEAAEAAYSRTRLEDWVFDAEVLAMARRLGYRLTETGIAWSDREGSRLSMPRVLVPAVRDLLAARRTVRAARESHAPGAGPPEAAAPDPRGSAPRLPEPAEPRS
jgi:dolichyl-phosphate beta-glucosyltransferase